MAAYTTTELLTAIERQSFSPVNQSTFSTTDILSLADEVIKSHILPAILATREEYYISYYDHSLVSGTTAYAIPPRAVGMLAREIQYIDSAGNITNLTRVSVDRLHLISPVTTSAQPEAFYLRGDDVVVLPTPSASSGSLRIYFAVRPGDLIAAASGAVISAINTSTNIVTVSSIPSTWATADVFDLVQRNGSQRYLSLDLTSTLVSGSAITLPSLPSALAIGDYVSPASYSPLVQMPPDFRPVLATLVAAEMLLSMNQPSGEKMFAKGIRNLEIATKMITPRVIGEDEVITPDWS